MRDRLLIEIATLIYGGGILLLWIFILRNARSAQSHDHKSNRWFYVVLTSLTIAVVANILLIRSYR